MSNCCIYRSRNSSNVLEEFVLCSPLALISMLYLDGVPFKQARFLAFDAFGFGVGYHVSGCSPTGKKYSYAIVKHSV